MKTNVFYHGDCLFVMRHDIPPESIDLIYLDPPFFTGKVQKGRWEPGAMEISFDDSKKFWGDNEKVRKMRNEAPEWLIHIAHKQPQLASYFFYMMERLRECYRILNKTGSIYLHCDYRASHYLKMIMDDIFKYENFRNEIVWCYAGGGTPKKDFPRKHDIILRYIKNINEYNENGVFNIEYRPYGSWTKRFPQTHGWGSGNISLDMKRGTPINDWWADLTSLTSAQKEWVPYPTQKPENLLERIIYVSSKKGDIVLDPFCGCGTAVIVAHKLGRKWIGIDVNTSFDEKEKLPLAFKTIKDRCIHQNILDISFDPPTYISRNLDEIMEMTDGNKFERWVNEFYRAKKPVDKGVDGITPDGIPIQVKTYKINDTIVNGFFGQSLIHHDVPKPLRVIRLVSKEGFHDNARQAQDDIKSQGVKVELITPRDMLKTTDD